jgi:CheY-like chemotaxis protein/anti-sigma regulatory factor (Ser/Thr protein kinase)
MTVAVQNQSAPGKRVLVVDDDHSLCLMVSKLLERRGFIITTANDGKQGLELLRKQSFDVVLLDVWMPEMTGFDLLTHAHAENINVPVVMMTSDDTPEAVLRAVREQAVSFLPKPFLPEALIEAVSQAASTSEVLPIKVLSAKPDWVEVEVPCQREAAERLYEFMLRLKAGLPEDVRDNLATAFRELLLNAVEWGGQLDCTRRVRVSYVRLERMIMYRIADPGPGFRFEGLVHAAVGNPDPVDHDRKRQEKGLRPGGFGILMTRSMVDELIYNEKQNEVLFVKYLEIPK